MDAQGRSRRALLGAGIGVGVGLAAGGCTRVRDGRALTLWAISYEGDWSPVLMPAFTARTGVPVEVQSLPATAAHEKLLTAFAGGSLPDVFMLPNGWVGEFAMMGAVAPVRHQISLADQFPGVVATVSPGGVAHAVPWSVAPQVQFYRRDLLAAAGYDAPPEDWAGWLAMGARLKRRRPDDYAALMLLNWWDALFTFAGQLGEPFLRERNTRGNFRSAAFGEALAFYASIFAAGLAPRVLSTEVQDPLAAFAQGYFAIYPSGPSLLLDLRRRAGEIPPERWGVARMPGPHGPGPVSGVSASLAVSAATPRPELAWALVDHLTSAASELRFQRLIGNLPARRSAWSSPQLDRPFFRPFAAQMQQPAPGPGIVEWERIRGEVQLVAERLVRGQLSLGAAQAEMDARVDRLLAKRRALVERGRLA